MDNPGWRGYFIHRLSRVLILSSSEIVIQQPIEKEMDEGTFFSTDSNHDVAAPESVADTPPESTELLGPVTHCAVDTAAL